MINLALIKRATYFDSIILMQATRSLKEMAGIEDAAVLMATPANLQLLKEAGLTPFSGVTDIPGSNDLLLVVRAQDEVCAKAALASTDQHFFTGVCSAVPTGVTTLPAKQARSLEEAQRFQPAASIAVISVPGRYAALEAEQALRAGLHVFLFSDNVALAEELALKRLGEERGLLVMGPDCGTARLHGAGLGFVNVVPTGPIGLIGASGTGMQQVMCLLAQSGYGVSQAIGCGGRDLSQEVGASTALQGLKLLQADEQTRVIVLISKPPAPEVARRVLESAASGQKPVVVIFVGAEPETWQQLSFPHLTFVHTLAEAAHSAIEIYTTGQSTIKPRAERASVSQIANQPPYLAALFTGGTLCEEALYLWGELIGPVYSNIALNPAWQFQQGQVQQGHYALDLGADEYTQGRPHPMIDPTTRLKYLREACNNSQVGVILLDIVLGYCAHPDPATIYAPIIQSTLQQVEQSERRVHFVISLCGTEDDPQGLTRQANRLSEAGAEIYLSNAEAALRCLALLNNRS